MLLLQKKKKVNTTVIFCTVVLSMFFSVHTVFSAAFDYGFDMPTPPAGTPGDFTQSIVNLTNWVLGFVTMIAVLALIWGGMNYLTSAGSEEQAKSGKQTIKYALLGLIVAGIAYALVNVVVSIILV